MQPKPNRSSTRRTYPLHDAWNWWVALGVKRLVVFGSAETDRFDSMRSDVDFLVEFGNDVTNRFDAYFGLKEALEALLGRPVDLVAPAALENPYFAAPVAENARELYAA